MDDVEEVKEKLLAKAKKPKAVQSSKLLSSGSVLLNLACTNNPRGAYPMGSYVFFVGDSDSGKTWYSMTMLAEAAINKRFADYRFIYDAPEGGAQMDIDYYFGSAVGDRLEAPEYDDNNNPLPSLFVEDFYFNLDKALNGDDPVIYILDSMDGLNARSADEKFDTDADAVEKGKDLKGSYGTAKAKVNSEYLRRVIPKLRATGSILLIISQTRDNIGFGSQFQPKTRGGGKALEFYADLQIWTSVKGGIKKTVKSKDRFVGNKSLCKIKRSRFTGRRAEVEVPFYHEHGIDDTGSVVQYLIDEGHWSKPKGKKNICAEEFEFEGSLEKLIQHIEENELEKDVAVIAGHVWNDIIEQSKVERKRRYE